MRTISEGSISDSLAGRELGFALVINGHSLVHALQPDLELLFIGRLPSYAIIKHITTIVQNLNPK